MQVGRLITLAEYASECAACPAANFSTALQPYGLGRSAIVGNVNFFMQVPVRDNGGAAVAPAVSPPGSYVDLWGRMRHPRGTLQLPADSQSLQRLQADPHPHHRLGPTSN